MNTRAINLCFCLFALLMQESTVLRAEEPQEEAEIKVGAVVPLSGSSAVYGEWTRRGLQLALAQENERRRQAKEPPISLAVEDNQFQPTTAITIFHALEGKGVLALFTTASPIAMVLAPLANRQGLPLIDVSAATPKYSTPDDFTFRTAVLADTLVQRVKTYLASLPAGRRTGALIIESEYGQGMLDSFAKGAPFELVRVENFKPGETDIRPQALRLRAAHIQYLWLVSQIKESSSLVRQLAQQLPGVQLVTDCYSVEAQDFLDSAGETAEGIVYAAPGCLLAHHTAATDVFLNAFRKQYGAEPNYFEAQAYDAANAFIHSARRCNNPTRTCVRDELNKLDIEGVCGRLKFDANGDVHYEAVLKRIEGKAFKLFQ